MINIKKILRFIRLLSKRIGQYLHEEYSVYSAMRENSSCKFETGIQVKNPDKLRLGKNVQIQRNTILHCGGFKWSDYKGFIEVGDDSTISPNCVFYGAGGIRIGKRFDCGPGVLIFSSRTDYATDQRGEKIQHVFEGVTIGSDVTLFGNVVINVGCKIGDRSVIGASSVVLCSIPPDEVWAGVPARFIKKRKED